MTRAEEKFSLTPEQLKSFEQNGFLAIDSLVPPEDLKEIEQEYEDLLDRLASKFVAQGKLAQTYSHLPFGQRYAQMVCEFPDLLNFMNI